MKSQYQKVFIAEDNPMYRFSLEAALGNQFPQVQSFVSGEELLRALPQNPDLVLLDHNFLDGKDGLDVLVEIKAHNPNIQVIYLSGQDEVKVAVESLKRGAFDYVEKGDGEFEKLQAVLERLEGVTRISRRKARLNWKRIFPLPA